MAQSLHNEKERSLREIQAKIADVEAEKVRAQQSMQEAKRLMQTATEGKDQVVLDMQATDNVEAERIKAVQALQNERQLRENAIQDLEAIKQAHGVSMDEKTAARVEAKRKEEVLSAEVHCLETEVSQMKSELHNAKEEI